MPKNISKEALLAGAPNKKCQPVAISGGSYFMKNGMLIAGVSKTRAANPVSGSTAEKQLGPVPVKAGMGSRTVQNDTRLTSRRG